MPVSFLSTFRRTVGRRLARLAVREALDIDGSLPRFRADTPTRVPSPRPRINLDRNTPVDRFRLSRSQAERMLLRTLLRGRKGF